MKMAQHTEHPDAADVTCIECGYDLHKLDQGGICPECGLAIARSIMSHRLAGANPKWLKRLNRGQMLLARSMQIVIWFTVVIFAVVFAMPILFLSTPGFPWEILIVAFIGGICIILAGLIGSTIGCFMITLPDPREALREGPLSPRIIARWGMLSAVVLAFINIALQSHLLITIPLLAPLMTLLLGAALTIGVVATILYLAKLTRQIPDAKLAVDSEKLAKRVRILLPVIFLLQSVGPMYSAITGSAMSRGGIGAAYSCFGLLVFIVLLAMLGRLSIVMSKYRLAFRACLAEAKHHEVAQLSTSTDVR